MEPELDAATLETWSRTVDEGPFSALCFGERMAFDNPETMTLLGAVAAWTARVRLVTTVVVPQLHDPVLLAKSLATADLLSEGPAQRRPGRGRPRRGLPRGRRRPVHPDHAGLAERVAVMRRVWAGKPVSDDVGPVVHRRSRTAGPSCWSGSMGPRTIRPAADWADGLAGFTLDLDARRGGEQFAMARKAWADAGRPVPRLATSFWFAISDDAEVARAGAPSPAPLHELASDRAWSTPWPRPPDSPAPPGSWARC